MVVRAAPPPLILASASPRRRELLERIAVELVVVPSNVDEAARDREDPRAYVQRIARAKAMAAVRQPAQWVLAADTIVTIGGAILGKPTGARDALDMLLQLAGRTHQVLTAFVLRGPGRAPDPAETILAEVVTTDVVMIAADRELLADYVTCGEWDGKAGAYAVQGVAAALVREVRGSITNVIGLPLAEVRAALVAAGAPAGDLAAGRAQ
jgi:septum formation protein